MIQYSTILKTSTAPVSSAWPSSKALQAKKHKTETYVRRKTIFVIKRSGRQLTKEDKLDRKGAFLDVAENKSRIQKSKYTGKVCSREKVPTISTVPDKMARIQNSTKLKKKKIQTLT